MAGSVWDNKKAELLAHALPSSGVVFSPNTLSIQYQCPAKQGTQLRSHRKKKAWLTGKPLAGKNDCRLNRPDESPHDETELCSA
ncbi:hypothetical protein [Comamonas guangdongensis]|uniref:Uncharacterized protein n=1 Tax=Comamonas guangdongensis TaxID=510515 RepID=A0ABV3ZRY3_9BURK